MRRQVVLVLAGIGLGAMCMAGAAQAQATSTASATLPLPPPLRDGATIVRLRGGGQADTLRAGTNPMVCFADNPADTLLDVRCYHSTFVPMIYAVRSFGPLDDSTREARIRDEIRAGRLMLPPFPTAGYRVLGPIRGYNAATNELGPEMDRWQSIHMPYATTTAVGMGLTELGAEPYMMSAGTWWSHVMIVQAPLRY